MTETNAYGQIVGAPVPGWTPRPLPDAAGFEGRYCRLERLDPARHGAGLIGGFRAAPDDRDWTWWRTARPADEPAFRDYVDSMATAPGRVAYAIIEAASGQPAGHAAFMNLAAANGALEIGSINFTPLLRRHRAGTEALFLMLRHAFDDLGYRRVEWQCNSLNLPSRAAALRLGFTFEGIFRQNAVTQGRNRDTAWFSILDSEWPDRRAALDAWLAPDNFDDAGRQRRKLSAFRT